MSEKILGQPFDIHTGGIDHIATHHNNEIAQSECANGVKLANYWLHVNYLTIDGKKISKSIGNTLYLDDLEKNNILIEAFKYWMLTAHYSSALNFTFDSVKAAETAFQKIINTFVNVKIGKIDKNYLNKILTNLNEDFNSPKAIATIWEIIKDDNLKIEDKKATIIKADEMLGLNILKLINEQEKKLKNFKIPKDILMLAEKRNQAKIDKNWLEADKIRDQINDLGYDILDSSNSFQIRPRK